MSQLPTHAEVVSTNNAAFNYGLKCGRAGFNECPSYDVAEDYRAWQEGYALGQEDAKNGNMKVVRLGPLLETFKSATQFNKQATDFMSGGRVPLKNNVIGVDAKNKVCRTPTDFDKAAYPVEVFLARPEA